MPIVVLTGPTAVGKTALAVAAAGRLDAEIVSADSRQIYRYLDIGTGKPTLDERLSAPHWMVDVAYPDQAFNVVDFQRGAAHALADIAARGKRALVVGGSPHYLSALIDGLEPPPVNLRLRRWLERADLREPGQIDAWLAVLDSAAARTIEPRNRRRVIRAVEATLTAGRPFSQAGVSTPRPDVLWVGLRLDRPALHQRVAERVRAMVEAGWLAEVRLLLAMGYSLGLPALSAAGYSELARVLRGEQDLSTAIQRVIYATNSLVRRQETWLRREPRLHWLDAAAHELPDQFIEVIEGA